MSHYSNPSQIVYNTLYFQKLFEQDEIYGLNKVPHAQYLSRLVNLNLGILFDINDKRKSCVISGFNVKIKSIDGSNAEFEITKGGAIINLFQIKLLENYNISVDFRNSNAKNIVFFLEYSENGIGKFNIGYEFLDENLNSNNWDENYLPIQIFKISTESELLVYSLTDFALPPISGITNGSEFDYNYYLSLGDNYNITYTNNDNISNIKMIVPIFSFPKKFIISNIEYIIPNRGYFLNLASSILEEELNKFNVTFSKPMFRPIQLKLMEYSNEIFA